MNSSAADSMNFSAAMAAVAAATASVATAAALPTNSVPSLPPLQPVAPSIGMYLSTTNGVATMGGDHEEDEGGDEAADEYDDEEGAAGGPVHATEHESGPPRKKKRRLTEEQIHQLSLARDLKGVTGKKLHTQHRLAVAAEIGLPESAVRNWLNNHKRKRQGQTQPAQGQPAMRLGHALPLPAQAVPTFTPMTNFPMLNLPGLNVNNGMPTNLNGMSSNLTNLSNLNGLQSMDWNNITGLNLGLQPNLMQNMPPPSSSNLTNFFLSQPNQFSSAPQPQQQQQQFTTSSTSQFSQQINFLGSNNSSNPSQQFNSNLLGANMLQQPQQQQLSPELQQFLQQQQQQQQQLPLQQQQFNMPQQRQLQQPQNQQQQQQLQLQQQLQSVMGDFTGGGQSSNMFTSASSNMGPSSSSSSVNTSGHTDPSLIPMLQARLAARARNHAVARAAENEALRIQQQKATQDADIMAQIQKIQRYNQVAVEKEQANQKEQNQQNHYGHLDYSHLAAPSPTPSSTSDLSPAFQAQSHHFTGTDTLLMSATSAGGRRVPTPPPASSNQINAMHAHAAQVRALNIQTHSNVMGHSQSAQPHIPSQRSESPASPGDTFESLRAQIRSLQQKLTDAFEKRRDVNSNSPHVEESKHQAEHDLPALPEIAAQPTTVTSFLRPPPTYAPLTSTTGSLDNSRASSRRNSVTGVDHFSNMATHMLPYPTISPLASPNVMSRQPPPPSDDDHHDLFDHSILDAFYEQDLTAQMQMQDSRQPPIDFRHGAPPLVH